MSDHDAALDDTPTRPDDDLHERAMRRFTAAVETQITIRALALEARRFSSIPGAQWEGDYGDQFANSPKMEINKVGRAVRKLKNDLRQNRVVPDFRPAGGKSDADTADTLDGMHRADSYHFKAQQARDNACEEAALGGFGAYRLTNEWADPLDKDSDEQRINPAMLIPDADQRVFFDPDSKQYDKSDARFAFVLTATSPEAFADEWGEDKAVSWPDGVVRLSYDWFSPEAIVQAEYYEIEERNESLLIFAQKDTDEEQRHWEKDLDVDDRADLKSLGWTERKRTVKRRRCAKSVLSGAEVLKGPARIAGGNIPIVPVYYERYYIDGVEWFKGVVQDRKDAQRLYNGQLSRLAEISALAPYERPIFAPEQMPPAVAETWARGNVDRHPYALVVPLRGEDGAIVTPGPIGKVEPPQVPQTTAALLEISNRDLTEDDSDDSQQVRANTSEEAMQLAAQRIDAKSGPFLDNVRQSVQREGELYLAAAREVYAEPGRVVETMTEDGDDGEAKLHEDYLDGATLKTRNNFDEGKYKVIASVQEATATRRDRTVKQMMSVAEISIKANDVEGAQAAIITASANMDGEGLTEYQDWNRKRGLKLELFKPNEDEKREAEEAAQQQGQQPDPQMVALQAQVEELKSKVGLNEAKTQESRASAVLKAAQAQAVGGPEAAPDAPSGLHAANDPVEIASKLASARLNIAKADHLQHDMHVKRIKTGHEIEMERRAQDHAERQVA